MPGTSTYNIRAYLILTTALKGSHFRHEKVAASSTQLGHGRTRIPTLSGFLKLLAVYSSTPRCGPADPSNCQWRAGTVLGCTGPVGQLMSLVGQKAQPYSSLSFGAKPKAA